jgi:hypothetical protein
MEKQSLADFQRAQDPHESILVLETYLSKADWYGKHGIKKTSLPDLKFWAEARLPELYEAIGDSNHAKLSMERAVRDSNGTLRAVEHSTTTNLMTPGAIREAARFWDLEIQPHWRTNRVAKHF